jgi:hypothetical protein
MDSKVKQQLTQLLPVADLQRIDPTMAAHSARSMFGTSSAIDLCQRSTIASMGEGTVCILFTRQRMVLVVAAAPHASFLHWGGRIGLLLHLCVFPFVFQARLLTRERDVDGGVRRLAEQSERLRERILAGGDAVFIQLIQQLQSVRHQ